MAKQELALTDALFHKRYNNGSEASLDRALAAEQSYAEALAELGAAWKHAGVLAMAAESYMNLFPWDYYQVCCVKALSVLQACHLPQGK